MKTIASWLSIALHPFVMVGVMVGSAATARQTGRDAVRTVAIVVFFTMVPLLALMVRQVRRGAWQNMDASNRAERPILYVAGGAALVGLLLYVALIRPQAFMVRGTAVTLGMLAVCAMATRWIKVSLHMAFGTLAAGSLALARSPVGYVLLMAMPALVWSRLTLERHSSVEVALGTAIGAAGAAALHFL